MPQPGRAWRLSAVGLALALVVGCGGAGQTGSVQPTPRTAVGTPGACPSGEDIRGDPTTRLYYLPGQRGYARLSGSVVCFASADAAEQAGYTRAPK